ncbi:MAG: response regulator transcription factor [Oscillospiraceae bacterium]|nr:response regulator transcription factor [Oscillospiraceae bacterium]
MNIAGKKVLIVEDEQSIVDILTFNLQKEGCQTIAAFDGEDGLNKALTENPDLILLDLMLPKMDGYEVCRRIRENFETVPIIMVTAREEEEDKVVGLEMGADDYITKPFSMRELLARVKTNMRRQTFPAQAAPSKVIRAGDVTLDPDSFEVTKAGRQIPLSSKEYDLLKYFMTNPEKVASREELMEKVWNYEYYGDMRTVDVTVRRLREKIETNPAEPEHIITRRGAGYLFRK